MDNNQFNQFNQNNPVGGMSTKKMFEYIGLGCSCFGFLLTFIFTIVTCSRSAKVSSDNIKKFKLEFGTSLWVIGVIIAVLIAITGLVFSILSKEKGAKLSKISSISVIVAVAAVVFAVFTNATICSYNCKMTGELEDMYNSSGYFD